jgi:hypothetical protein
LLNSLLVSLAIIRQSDRGFAVQPSTQGDPSRASRLFSRFHQGEVIIVKKSTLLLPSANLSCCRVNPLGHLNQQVFLR